MLLSLRYSLPLVPKIFEPVKFSRSARSVVVCAARGPRPRYPRVWKARRRIGTVSKSAKLVTCIKGLSNVKEEVYGALDSFIAWELEFPLITVKKALKSLENEKDWKRIIQVTKWMLSKGQGRTMGTYFLLLNALAEDGRLDEAEELWTKIFTGHLEGTPRIFFDKMISIYYKRGMHEKMFEIFADMEELGVGPNASIVSMMGNVFQKLGMLDKYEKLMKKYPPPKWEYRYIKGKRIRIRAKSKYELDSATKDKTEDVETKKITDKSSEEAAANPIESFEEIEANSNASLEGEEANSSASLEEAEAEANSNVSLEEAEANPNELFEEIEANSNASLEEAEANSNASLEEAEANPNELFEEIEANSSASLEEAEANSNASLEEAEANPNELFEEIEANSNASLEEAEANSNVSSEEAEVNPNEFFEEIEANSNASLEEAEAEANSNASLEEAEANSNASLEEAEANSNVSLEEAEAEAEAYSNASLEEAEANPNELFEEIDRNTNASLEEAEANPYESSEEIEANTNELLEETEAKFK